MTSDDNPFPSAERLCRWTGIVLAVLAAGSAVCGFTGLAAGFIIWSAVNFWFALGGLEWIMAQVIKRRRDDD